MNLFIFNFNYKTMIILGTIIVLVFYTIIIFSIEEFSKNTIMKIRGSQYEDLMYNGLKKEIALLGTSHTIYAHSIRDKNFMNYGAGGTFFLEMYYKTLKLIKYAKHLKILLIEVDDFQFTIFAENKRNIVYNYLYPDKDNSDIPNTNFFYSFNDNVKPIIHKEIFKRMIGKPSKLLSNNKMVEINGEIYPLVKWLDYDKNKRIEDAKIRLKFHYLDHDSELSIKLLNYLEKTILLAKNNNLKIIFIKNPLSNEFLENMDTNLQKRIEETIQRLMKKYSLHILDYRLLFYGNQEFFRDQDHLNPLGWKKISEKLMHDISKFIPN